MSNIVFRQIGVPEIINNPKFKHQTHKVQYYVNIDEDCEDYEDQLIRLVNENVAQAIKESEEEGEMVYKIAAAIHSDRLVDGIFTGFLPTVDFQAERLLTKFSKVQQSANTPSIIGEPFTLDISTVRGKTGGRRPQGESQLNSKTGVFEIRNTGSDCFILASLVAFMKIAYSGRKQSEWAYRIANQTPSAKQKYIEVLAGWCTSILKNSKCTINQIAPVVERYLELEYPQYKPIRIVVFATRNFNDDWLYPLDKHVNGRTYLPIYYNNNHFDAIWYTKRFFQYKHQCYICHVAYSDKLQHSRKCLHKCHLCGRVGPDFPCKFEDVQYCANCSTTFPNFDCYNVHQQRACRLYKTCQICEKRYNTKEIHECGSTYCQTCHSYHSASRSCFVQPLKAPAKAPSYKLFVYDFETTQTTIVEKDKKAKHVVNFCAVKTMCDECMTSGRYADTNSCDSCTGELNYWSIPEDENCEPLKYFWQYLRRNTEPGKTNIAVGHYAGRFDIPLLMEEIISENEHYNLQITNVGNKIYSLVIKGGGEFGCIKFIDSYNHIPVPLEKMIETLDLKKIANDKGTFPHLFNQEQFYEYVNDGLPPIEYYNPDSMLTEKRAKFLEWYEKHKSDDFNFKRELREYCINDVMLLAHALVTFRRQSREATGCPTDDILYSCTTLASACMRDFRMTCMPKDSIALVPEKGIGRYVNQSKVALKMLRYLKYSKGYELRFRDTPGGEYKLKVEREGKIHHYFVDGFVDRSPAQSLVIEIYGCFFHGCPKCFKYKDIIMPLGQRREELYLKTMQRQQAIENAGHEVETYWECDIQKILSTNEEMRNFFNDEIKNPGPLVLRDAFSGGRTGPSQLYAKADENFEITYTDIQSLYPYVLVTYPMPHGIPEHVLGSGPVLWNTPEIIKDDGVYKVLVVPPTNLAHPVLPSKINDQLMFVLCVACAKENCKTNFPRNLICRHTENERQFVATVASVELRLALEKGYIVKHFYEMYRCNMSKDIFKPYVMKNLKLKLEASGPPPYCSSDAQKIEYCNEVKRRYGFELNQANWIKNAGLRTIAKLRLNSLWGKFGQRSNLSHVEVCRNPNDFHRILRDYGNDVCKVNVVNDTVAFTTVRKKEGFDEEYDYSNILLPIFTTASARVHLYRFMDRCQGSSTLLYTDTDSCVILHPRGQLPFKIDYFLGDMEREHENNVIEEFICGGAKQYGLKMRDANGTALYELKLRGITLSYSVKEILNYKVLRELILGITNSSISTVTDRIQPVISKGVYTVKTVKKYQPVFYKGFINNQLAVLPYGFKYSWQT
ncbi:unnamed protein product [Bursaphelenchus xylophilus]|uniref:DNA-directed DNA polymerase n=1 Tax=Bursaphelenchus xylophilus TaxID=6326 RepID=A0A1I7SFM8_BURXY|nr:unnamed protein product [Bursaphelenchus xylophilus]CAD5232371.1 unnamed protein product [Bursaphelenchus xylophilus]CAG9112963.1 unnamed protein product [Bursaphelenchus xylophilus]CAG9124696.1 unnamed protein product [Bursaphelenchus xylophilus]